MKTRILFVDDEPLILQGLQRMLRSTRDEWDTTFVESGPAALRRLEQEPFDVVVSDMRMPGMDGATLLNEVMQRFPRTVRFILSGHADRDMVMRCVGATHQYLSKPCEPDTLRSTIQRALAMQIQLHDENLRRLIGRVERLPSLPSLYVEIVEKLRQTEVGLEDIAAVLARDVAMTAKILKLVNSAFFGLGRPIASVADAVSYLGIETIKSLVLTMHAFGQFRETAVPLAFIEDLWTHSLGVAAGARALAENQGLHQKLADQCFSGGMLHDVGKLILCCNFVAEYREVQKLARLESLPLWQAELRLLGASHASVGAYLLGLWGLPPAVVDAIRLHHCPSHACDTTFTPLTAVHLSECLSHRPKNTGAASSHAEPDRTYLEAIAATNRIAEWTDIIQKTSSPA
jgi:putative nucleotidyltransferase with HDIG domain